MSKYINPKYAELTAYTPGEQPLGVKYIKLNTNESPYPPSKETLDAVNVGETELLRLYPDPDGRILTKKIADLYGVESKNVFLANGSDDILNFAFMAYCANGRKSYFADITYGFYKVFADLYGIEADIKPLKADLTVNVEDYIHTGKFTVLANPNAPTGIALPISEIERIISSNADNVVLIDEAYVDFGGESAVELVRKYDNLIVCQTYSKSRSMAGARLGFCFASAEIIKDLELIKYSTNPYNVNRLTLRLGEATVDAESYYQEKCAAIIATREETAKALKNLGFTVLPSRTNFLFVKSDKIGGRELYEKLKDRGILVRHFGNVRISDYIRMTIGTDDQMATCLAAIRAILEE